MIVRYDTLKHFEMPRFVLCNPGSVYTNQHPTNVIGDIPNHTAEEIVFNFNEVSELNLRVYDVEYSDPDDNQYASMIYNSIQNKRLIFTEDYGYFIINNINTGYKDGEDYKDINARTVEDEITRKNIPFIKDGTYKFYTSSTDTDKDPGLLNVLMQHIDGWTLGNIDEAVASKYRTFEDVDTGLNCLGFLMQDMQDAYECIFIFDNKNRIIDVYDQNNYVKRTNIHLTKDDLLESLDYSENADELYTALSVLGGDNITIAPINPLGANTIYDFTYYLSWMPQDFAKKVLEWQNGVKDSEPEYKEKNLLLYTKLEEASNLKLEIERIDTQIDLYTKCKNNIIAESDIYNDKDRLAASVKEMNEAIARSKGMPITATGSIKETIAEINKLISEATKKKEDTNNKLNTVNIAIDSAKNDIKVIQEKYDIQKYFTAEEFKFLSNYIFEGNYHDEHVVITDKMTHTEQFKQMEILYDRAWKQFKRCSSPTQEFNVDSESFIFDEKFKEWSYQLETGSLINVELKTNDIAALFLSNFTVNFEERSLSMQFGNRFNKFDPKALFDEVLGNINKSSNSLGFIKDILAPIRGGELTKFRAAIEASRNLTMDGALHSENEEVIIDNSGYTARKKLPDGSFDPRQLKIIGKTIVFTEDNWETCSTAVGEIVYPDGTTSYGINGETLIGNIIIGNQLRILNKDGEELFTVIDGKINSIIGKVDKIENDTNQNNDKLNNSPKSVVVEYAQNDSPTIPPPEEAWSTNAPTWIEGKFIWSRNKTTLNNGTVTTTDPVCITGAKGESGRTPIKGVDYFDGDNGQNIFIKYSEYEDGSSPTDKPNSRTKYIGVASTNATTAPSDPKAYEWSKYIGEDGVPGDSNYIHIAYCNVPNPTIDEPTFSTTDATDRKYIGTCTNDDIKDPEDPTAYTWALIKGKDGKTPVKGVDYFDGKNGYNIFIRYSEYEDGSNMTEHPNALTKYIGIANTTDTVAPQYKEDYEWSKYSGEDGTPGESNYIHIAYCNVPNPVQGEPTFSTTDSTGRDYIGTCTDDNVKDPENPEAYHWALMKGTDGVDGQSVISIKPMYCISDDKKTPPPPSADWKEIAPEWKPGFYMWTKNVITFKDGNGNITEKETEPVCSSEWEAIENVQIGGRNLILDSGSYHNSDNNVIYNYKLTSEWVIGQEYTLTVWGDIFLNDVVDPNSEFYAMYDNGAKEIGALKKRDDGRWIITFKLTEDPTVTNDITICARPMTYNQGYQAYVKRVKLETGNKGTDWTAAPEELEDKVEAIESTYSEITQKNDQIQSTVKTIQDNMVTTEVMNETIVNQTSSQIDLAVKGLQEDGLTLSNEYKFNNNGLTISSSDSNITTRISEDGMSVFIENENGDPATGDTGVDDGIINTDDSMIMLEANHEGVKAKNLEATTYLIIGGRSRLENYGTDRTGCFWIG